MTNGEWNPRLLKTYKATIDFLEQVKANTPFDYKPLRSIELYCYWKDPEWEGETSSVKMGYNNEPEALAHELAHGLHEKIRENGHDNKHGEEFCDAIRYFVEKKILPDSEWLKDFKGNVILEACHSKENEFIKTLDSTQFFSGIGWS